MSTDPKPSNVRELYVQAARIKDDAARKTFLDEACGTKIELRQRVEQLLAARRADQENLLQLATSDSMSGRSSLSSYGAELGRTFQRHPESMGVDQTADEAIRGQIDVSTHPIIGNYRLLEELGHGGMGTVYMAAQAKPVKRQVALKVIKPGMDSHEVIARFEAERQALAMMDHPNIARVLDGGTTKEGRPYFVMELVRGIAITEFCRQKSLPLRDRLELFVDICHAVQHAHQKGIIHRDLKPGNIMITLHDGKPVVKVIDFGVAKALHQELTERTLFTHFSHMVGTPLYMSPEQSEMSGLGVDTRSDIYSLGVVLYELLTGTTPFERDAMSRLGIDGIRKLIQEQEPPRPSVRISTLRAANESTIDDQRQLDIAGSAIQLRGEVDWIVMKALEKDRTRRYETAEALAEDVRRFLHHRAVLARPQSILYQASKFIARNKVAVGTTIAIGIVALLGFAGTIWQARKFEGERNLAVELGMELKEQLSETKVANAETRKQAAISKAISDYLQNDLLAKASPENEQYRDVKLRTVLDLAAKSIDSKFNDQPLVEAALRQTIGVTYHQLGEHDLAKSQLLHALKIRRESLGIDAAESIQSQVELGSLLTSMGSFDESDSYLADAVGLAKAVLGPEHDVTIQAMYALGSLRVSQDQLDEALVLGKTLEKVGIENQQLEDESILKAASLSAVVYERQSKYEEAYKIFDRNYKTRLNVLGGEHPLTLSSLNGRALTSLKLGKKEEAVRDAETVLNKGRKLYGADHPSTANLINSLATIYASVGRKNEALRLHREAVEIGDRTLGAEHPQMLQYLNNLGARLLDFEKYDEAQRIYVRAHQVAVKELGAGHIVSIVLQGNLAASLRSQGKTNEALIIYHEVLSRLEETKSETHPFALESRLIISALLLEENRYEDAFLQLNELLGLIQSTESPDQKRLASVHSYLADVHVNSLSFEEAERVQEVALKIRTRLNPDSWIRYSAEAKMGRILLELDDLARAEALLVSGFRGMEEQKESIHPLSKEILPNAAKALARLYEKKGEHEKVKQWKRKQTQLELETVSSSAAQKGGR